MTRKIYFFTVMTALFLLAAPNIRAAQSGTCGTSVTWTLDDQCVLTIEGTGAMYDYSSDSPSPWKNLSPTKAVIKEGVTTIGSSAFSGCSGLTSVDIPASVTSIGNYAFYNCSGLTSVDIPNSVTSIGETAFYKCSGLTSVTIPNSVTSIGEEAFSGCKGLTSIAIPGSVTSIGEYTFYNCSGLKSVTIPASVTSIGEMAFVNCSGLEKIESLAETPPTCGSYAFYGVDMSKCVLTVPGTAIEAYKAAEGWKEFLQIISGIHGVAQDNNAGVSARNGEITVTGAADNAVVEVYSTSGALVYRGANKTVSVPSAGIYIVKAAGRTFKVKTTR